MFILSWYKNSHCPETGGHRRPIRQAVGTYKNTYEAGQQFGFAGDGIDWRFTGEHASGSTAVGPRHETQTGAVEQFYGRGSTLDRTASSTLACTSLPPRTASKRVRPISARRSERVGKRAVRFVLALNARRAGEYRTRLESACPTIAWRSSTCAIKESGCPTHALSRPTNRISPPARGGEAYR